MSNVVNFPPKDGNDWVSVRESLRTVIREMHKDASQNFENYVLDRMAPVYKEMPFTTELSAYSCAADQYAVSEVISGFLDDFQKHVSKLMISRLIVEIELAIALRVS